MTALLLILFILIMSVLVYLLIEEFKVFSLPPPKIELPKLEIDFRALTEKGGWFEESQQMQFGYAIAFELFNEVTDAESKKIILKKMKSLTEEMKTHLAKKKRNIPCSNSN